LKVNGWRKKPDPQHYFMAVPYRSLRDCGGEQTPLHGWNLIPAMKETGVRYFFGNALVPA
jgi:hypothetical protein